MIELAPTVLAALAMLFPAPRPVVCELPGMASPTDRGWLHEGTVYIAPELCAAANTFAITARNANSHAFATIAHEQEHWRHPGEPEWKIECRAQADVISFARVSVTVTLPPDDLERRLARLTIWSRYRASFLGPAYQSSCIGRYEYLGPPGLRDPTHSYAPG